MKNKDLVVGAAWGLAVGMAVGAVAALLLAPASGSETRRRLLFERDHTLETARRKARRAMTRLRRAQSEPEMEPEAEDEEEEGAFSGA